MELLKPEKGGGGDLNREINIQGPYERDVRLRNDFFGNP